MNAPSTTLAVETLADDADLDVEQQIEALDIPLVPPAITPTNGFMIDQDGNRVGTLYTTPRPCLKCGTMFVPQRTSIRRIPTTCSEPCRRRYAVKQITAIGQEAKARKEQRTIAR